MPEQTDILAKIAEVIGEAETPTEQERRKEMIERDRRRRAALKKNV